MEGTIAHYQPNQTNVISSTRRVPGAGLAGRRPLPVAQSPVRRASPQPGRPKLSFKPEVPKQWRHFSIIALAMMIAAIGVDSRPIAQPSEGAFSPAKVGRAQASESILHSLPTVKSVSLAPVPILNTGIREPDFAAQGVVIMDDATKMVIYDKAGGEKRAVASTTKIITALVVMDQYKNLDQVVTISKEAINQIGSAVGFRLKETATIRQLLYGLMMVSGNDAALQLTEQLLPSGGAASTEQFVLQMNKKAEQLGMLNTHFYDAAGLNDQGYSTPTDMAKGMSALVAYPELTKMIGMADYSYTSPEGYLHTFKNSNRLVTQEMYYQGIIGGKTGFTPETPEGGAGHCLIAAAERNGHRLIVAVYGTYSGAPQASAEVARQALDYAYKNFTWQSIVR